jgi:hypothetical protein
MQGNHVERNDKAVTMETCGHGLDDGLAKAALDKPAKRSAKKLVSDRAETKTTKS